MALEQPSIFDMIAGTGAKPGTLRNSRQSRVSGAPPSSGSGGPATPTPSTSSSMGRDISAGVATGRGVRQAIDNRGSGAVSGTTSSLPPKGSPSLKDVAMLDTGVATDASPVAGGVTAPGAIGTTVQPATGKGTTIMVANALAGRHGDVSPSLLNAVAARVEQAYGPGYTVVLRSGEGESSTGTQRHNTTAPDGLGIAGDFQIKAPDGHQLAGAELDPLANGWIGVEGSMGINQKGGDTKGSQWTHMDLVGGQNPAGRPLRKDEGTHWYYGSGKYKFDPVRQVESQIRALGYDTVEQFQDATGLEVDGVIGPNTTAAANREFAANNVFDLSPQAAAEAAAPGGAQDATIAAAQPSLEAISPAMGYAEVGAVPPGPVSPTPPVAAVPAAAVPPPSTGPVIGSGAVITDQGATQVASAAPAAPQGTPGRDPRSIDPWNALVKDKDQSRIAPSQPSLEEIALQGTAPATDAPTDGMASRTETRVSTPTPTASRPVLRRNSPDREAVMAAQAQIVKDMPWLGDQFVDGDYGPQTIGAVKAIQSKYGAKSVDGQIGPETWGILDSVEPVTFMPPERPDPNDPTLTGNRPLSPEMPGYREAVYEPDYGTGTDVLGGERGNFDVGTQVFGGDQTGARAQPTLESLTDTDRSRILSELDAFRARDEANQSGGMSARMGGPPAGEAPLTDADRSRILADLDAFRARDQAATQGFPEFYGEQPSDLMGGMSAEMGGPPSRVGDVSAAMGGPPQPSINDMLTESGLDQQLMSLGWTPPAPAGPSPGETAPSLQDIAAGGALELPSSAPQVAALPADMNTAAYPTTTFDDVHSAVFGGQTGLSDMFGSPPVVQGQSPSTLSLDAMPGSDAVRMAPATPPPAPSVPVAQPTSLAQPSLADAGLGTSEVQSRSAVAQAGMPATATGGVDPVTGQPMTTGGGSSYIGGPPAGGGTGGSSSSGTPGGGAAPGGGGSSQPAYYDQASGGWQTWNSSTGSYQAA